MAKKRVHRSGPERAPERPSAPGSTAAAKRPSGPRPSLRDRFEDGSAPFLVRMQSLPGFLVPVALALMLFFGLVLNSPWAGILLILIGLFLTWLTAVSWPAISSGSRMLRIAVDFGMLALGVLKLLGRI